MQDGFSFSFWNPNGQFRLNLANFLERDVAICLFVMDKEARKKMEAGEMCDRSQQGNKSVWRGEKYNGARFVVTNGKVEFCWLWVDWIIPHNGILEINVATF